MPGFRVQDFSSRTERALIAQVHPGLEIRGTGRRASYPEYVHRPSTSDVWMQEEGNDEAGDDDVELLLGGSGFRV
jgi:hypothetical protein